MQFRTQPRKLPTVLSIEEVSEVIAAAPGPGLKYRAALSISYGAGLRASEVCNLKVSDIDSDRMLIHVDEGKGGKDRKVMLSPDLLDLLRDYWREARPAGLVVSRQAQDQPNLAASVQPGVQLGQAFGRDHKARNLAHAAAQLCHASVGGKHRCAGDPSVARACQAEHDGALHPCRHQRRSGTRPARSKHSSVEPENLVTDRVSPVSCKASAGDR